MAYGEKPRRKGSKMDAEQLSALLDAQINDSDAYDRRDLSVLRERALKFFDGDLSKEIPSQVNRSQVVSRDFSDTHGWIMPGLLRVFLATDRVALYEPRRKEVTQEPVIDPQTGQPKVNPQTGQPVMKEKDLSVERAQQATDYVNYVFLRECSGYRVLHSGFHDGLSFGNGLVKHWWDPTKEYRTDQYTGLDQAQALEVLNDPDVEEDGILEFEEREAPPDDQRMAEIAAAMASIGQPPPMVYDIKVERCTSRGRLRVKAMPPNEFLIDRDAIDLDEESVTFCAHRTTVMRSDLIEDGHDPEIVEQLPVAQMPVIDDGEKQAREPFRSTVTRNSTDKSTDLIDKYECYVKCDYDGDGIAEWRQVIMVGGTGKRHILSNEEWGEELPFTDLMPDPVPHRWRGRSLFEEIEDIQKVKTTQLRAGLDNLYWINNPQRTALENQVVNPDELHSPTFGGTVITKVPGAVALLPMEFIADKAFAAMDKMDQIREFRTGVSAATLSLDPEALQNQTATAVNNARTASYTKVETYARNLSEMGLQRLFSCLLKLVVKNQDRPRTIRLRGEWVDMDPSAWDPDMEVSINVGLGTGTRDRDLMMLNQVAMKQEQIVLRMGPTNPWVGIEHLADTYQQMAEAASLKNPERYFPEVTDEMKQQIAQTMQQMQENDPKVKSAEKIAQIKTQGEQQKAMIQHQAKQAEANNDLQVKAVEMQNEQQLEQVRAAGDMQIRREELEAEIAAKREQMMHEVALEREKMANEIELERQRMQQDLWLEHERNVMGARRQAAQDAQRANLQNTRMGGEFG